MGKKIKGITKLIARIELEEKALHRPNNAIAINTESLLRSRLHQFVALACTRPEFVVNSLRDRLILICEADDPAARSLQGRTYRGETIPDIPGYLQGASKEVLKIREGAEELGSLGIPVLTINLDRPISQNVALVAKFLHENGVASGRIRRWAKRAREECAAGWRRTFLVSRSSPGGWE